MERAPTAPRRQHTHSEHGIVREDPWYWLRDRDDPDVISYIEAENAWTEARLEPLASLRAALYAEMVGRVQETDVSAPVPNGPWEYYCRTYEGKAYPVYCRRPRGGGDEQVILDVNRIALDHEFVDVLDVDVSPDHSLVAYTLDTTGRETYEIIVLDLSTGAELERFHAGGGSVTWTADSAHVLWNERDDALRPYRIRLHRIGATGDDPILLEEPDPRFTVSAHRTRSDRWIVITAYNVNATEIYVVPADDPTARPRSLQPREEKHRYGVVDHGDDLYILSDHGGALNRRLLRAPHTATSSDEWVEVLAHRPGVELVSVSAFAEHLVLTEREDGQRRLVVWQLATDERHTIVFPEDVCVVDLGDNREVDVTSVRVSFVSMTTPHTTYDYDLNGRVLTLVKQTPTPTYDPATYRSERRWATAEDGARIPCSLMMRRDTVLSPQTPVFLYGYGAYGITLEPRFYQYYVSMVDRGAVVVLCHPRGGGFLGRPWYEAGKLAHKDNTFSDFATCARSLHADGLSSPDRTVIAGGSAGGLTVGAVINRFPEICTAAIASVPFVDVVTTMLDESLPLTAGEWDEWGDPREETAFRRMLSYSPYDNVEARPYPDLLVISGLNDPRVQYWEPTKWVAKLRAIATEGDVLLFTHMGAGHAGSSGRYGFYEDRARQFAWALDRLGLTSA